MGCGSSKPAAGATRANRSNSVRKSKNATLDLVTDGAEMSDSDLHKMKDDILQRHDTEIDIVGQIAAERLALKNVSFVQISRSLSCEDLMDTLTNEDFTRLHDNVTRYNINRQYHLTKIKQQLSERTKPWVVSILNKAYFPVHGLGRFNVKRYYSMYEI